jgi:hypothetical protein
MYMIGQVAVMHNKIISLLELHQDVAENNYQHILSCFTCRTGVDRAFAGCGYRGYGLYFPGSKKY